MEKEKKIRTVTFYKDYFINFFIIQREKVQDKITWTLELIEHLEKIPETYLKHLENTDGLYEIRVKQGSDIFRIFCFFDKGKLLGKIEGYYEKNKKANLIKKINEIIK